MDPFQLGPGLVYLAIFGLGGIVAIVVVTILEGSGKSQKK